MKLYSQLDFITYDEALEYATTLLGIELEHKSFERLVLPHIDAYLDFNENGFFLDGAVYVDGFTENDRVNPSDSAPHKVHKGDADIRVSKFGPYIAYPKNEIIRFTGPCRSFSLFSQGQDDDLGVIDWYLYDSRLGDLLATHQYGEFASLPDDAPFIVFSPKDIEALAAKMNNEPDAQALQEENQRLKQEIETLKAEVERLAKEAAIAPPDSHGLEFNHATRHLELVSKVQQKFYDPEGFDAKDPGTRPKKDVIIRWLTSQFEVSQTDANAIERVATPFDRGPASK